MSVRRGAKTFRAAQRFSAHRRQPHALKYSSGENDAAVGVRCSAELGDDLGLWNIQGAADFSCEVVRDFGVPRNRFNVSSQRIGPKLVLFALALEVATKLSEMTKQFPLLHETTTVPFSALDGTPRKPSSRRSSRMREMAAAKLARHSSAVLP